MSKEVKTLASELQRFRKERDSKERIDRYYHRDDMMRLIEHYARLLDAAWDGFSQIESQGCIHSEKITDSMLKLLDPNQPMREE